MSQPMKAQVRFIAPTPLWKALKRYAKSKNISMGAAARLLITEGLEREAD